jgi:aspartate/methionine/tyrosine aminotransferase
VPTPSYPLFEFLAGLQDVRLVPYSLFYDHGWQIGFHSVETVLTPRTRAIILVHPNNPTGSYVKYAEREALNRICTERELALVVDEVFLDYEIDAALNVPRPRHSEGAQPVEGPAVDLSTRAERSGVEGPAFTFAANTGALTFTLSGVSKISGLPQMKLAWIVISGPDTLANEATSRLEIIADTYLSMNAPIQLATPQLLHERHSIREQLMTRIRRNLAELDAQLRQQRMCSRLKVEGGWYAVLRVPVTRTDEQLCIELLENTDVLVQPGYFYDFHSDGYLVVSLITPEATFKEGLARVLCTF